MTDFKSNRYRLVVKWRPEDRDSADSVVIKQIPGNITLQYKEYDRFQDKIFGLLQGKKLEFIVKDKIDYTFDLYWYHEMIIDCADVGAGYYELSYITESIISPHVVGQVMKQKFKDTFGEDGYELRVFMEI